MPSSTEVLQIDCRTQRCDVALRGLPRRPMWSAIKGRSCPDPALPSELLPGGAGEIGGLHAIRLRAGRR
jgi:hypothetical protein